jgi:hypothetical protein
MKKLITPIDKLLARETETLRLDIKSLGDKFSLVVTGLERDMSLKLPDLAIIYAICEDLYRYAIKKRARVVIRDRDTTLRLIQGDLVVLLNLQDREAQIERDIKRIKASRRKFGRTPTRKVKKHDPKAMYPFERTW